MKRLTNVAVFLLAADIFTFAQEPPAAPPPTGTTALQQQQNAASANKDTSGTTGDQITKPPAAKGSTVIGCLSGPDQEGKFLLRNMNYRHGVHILGGVDDLKNDSGSKVRLTGQWLAPVQQQSPTEAQSQSKDKVPPEMRRFQVTDVEVVSPKCQPPSETTPDNPQKRGKTKVYNAPSSDSSQ